MNERLQAFLMSYLGEESIADEYEEEKTPLMKEQTERWDSRNSYVTERNWK